MAGRLTTRTQLGVFTRLSASDVVSSDRSIIHAWRASEPRGVTAALSHWRIMQ